MKKIILFVAACVAFAACTKEVDFNAPVSASHFEKGQKVTLSVNSGDQTKVSNALNDLTGAVDFKWEAYDKIKVTVGKETAEFTLIEGAGTTSGTFEGTMPADGDNFDVQYPVDDPDLSSQTYAQNALPRDKMKMTATGCTLDTPFTITPQYAALRLNVYAPYGATISKIVVTNTSSAAAPKPSYTLDCGTGISLGTHQQDSSIFFVVVPAGTYKFSAEFFDNAETPASISKFEPATAQAFTAGKLLNMPSKSILNYTINDFVGNYSVQGIDNDGNPHTDNLKITPSDIANYDLKLEGKVSGVAFTAYGIMDTDYGKIEVPLQTIPQRYFDKDNKIGRGSFQGSWHSTSLGMNMPKSHQLVDWATSEGKCWGICVYGGSSPLGFVCRQKFTTITYVGPVTP